VPDARAGIRAPIVSGIASPRESVTARATLRIGTVPA